MYKCQKITEDEIKSNLKNICASYQEAIIDSLLLRVKFAIEKTKINIISISGGVAANKRFREKLQNEFGISSKIFFPPIQYCTDNAVMIGLTGDVLFSQGSFSNFNLKPIPNLSLK